jgi:hypothetical protein
LREQLQAQGELTPPRAVFIELFVEGSAHSILGSGFEYSIRPHPGLHDF